MLALFRVRGDSMLPTLKDGDIVITVKPRTPRAGFIYVCHHSDLGQIIKRLSGFDARGRAVLSGDNPNSTPSAVMGTVEPERLMGRAVFSIGKSGIRRLGRKAD